jgi:CheY-like chemotaxis protein
VDWLQKPIDRARLSRSLQKALLRNSRPRILHVESDRDTIGIIEPLIEEIGEYVLASTLNEAEARLASEKFDLVLLNITFPEGNALELVTELQGQCPVVLFTGQDVDIDLKGKFAAMLHKSSVSKKHILETIKQNIKRAG